MDGTVGCQDIEELTSSNFSDPAMTELRNGDNQLSVIEGTHVHAYHQMRVSVTGPCVKDSRWENGTKSRKEALTMDSER